MKSLVRKHAVVGAVFVVGLVATLSTVAFTGPLSLPFTDRFATATNLDLAASTARYSPAQEAVLMAFKKRRYGFAELVVGSDLAPDALKTRAFAVGDLDGDGDLDVVEANYGSTNLVYLNNGTADPFNGVTGKDLSADIQFSSAVAVGDLNGDGHLDVVVGNVNEANRVYLNNGTPDPFNGVAGSDLTADAQFTTALTLADLDGDGDLDVVAGNASGQANRVYLNNGLADPFSGVTGSNLTSDAQDTFVLAVADLDGDGDMDVIAGNYNQVNRIYLNNGTPAPFDGVTGSDLTSDVQKTRGLAVGDVDGDGDIDAVVGNDGEVNRVYLNNGTAAPFNGVTGSDLTVDAQPTTALAIADVDADGDLDVVAGNYGVANRVYRNNGTVAPFNGVTGSDFTADTHATLALAVADLDGDGDVDVLAANYLQVNRVYLNNSAASPFAGVTGGDLTADADNTDALAAADLDGDGDLDVVAGNESGVNRVYLNNGTADPFNGVTGSDLSADAHTTIAIAVADLDGDGDVDVVAGNAGQPNRVYLNNGTADPFNGVTGSDLTTDAQTTTALAVADLDGDGDLDVIAGNFSATNRVYLNNGTADPFNGVTGSDLTADAHWTYGLAVADLDGDGDVDVVAGNDGSANRLYLNNGTADPFNGVTGRNLTADAQKTYAVAAADIDGDGDVDVVAGNLGQTNRLYLNNGTADPFNGVTGSDLTADVDNTYALVIADLDVDGDLDVVAGNWGQTNRLYLNNGTADPFNGVEGSDLTADAHNTHAIVVGDLDGDGAWDVVAGNAAHTNRIYLSTADLRRRFAGSNLAADAHNTVAVAAGDLDGDGDLDVVAGNYGQVNRVYLNNGTTDPFSGVVGANLTADAHKTDAIVVADLDGDGDLDIVAGNFNEANRIYLNDGSGTGWSGSDLTADVHYTMALAVVDLDGDGDVDVIAGNNDQGGRIYLNDGSGSGWSGSDLTAEFLIVRALAVADLDGDGDPDVVTGRDGGRNRLYLNNGTADPFLGVTGSDLTADNDVTVSLAVADLNGDGHLDVVAGNFASPNRVYLNNGKANPFSGVTGSDLTSDEWSTRSVAVADLDGDGDADVITGNASYPDRVYLNNGTANPFSGVTGSDLIGDADNTTALGVGDLDGDGALDVIAVNYSGINRVYRSMSYNTAGQKVVSVSEGVPEFVPSVPGAALFFAAEHDVPPGTSIDYFLSNDGGAKWLAVRSGKYVTLPPGGSELKWRAELHSLSPIVSPVLHSVVVKYAPQLAAAPILDAEAAPALSSAEAADGTVVTVPLDGRYVLEGDSVSVYWGAAGAATATVKAADITGASVNIFVDAADILSQGEGSVAVTATVTDAYANTSAASPAVLAVVDFTAPGAPGAPVLSAEVTDGVLDAFEVLDGTLVSVGLTGTGAVTGDTVTVLWSATPTTKLISAGDVAAGSVVVTVPATAVGAVKLQAINVRAYVTDLAGNASGTSSPAAAMVSTDGGDQDGDGLGDSDEVLRGTKPTVGDTDGDGLADGLEVVLGSDPASKDTDGDGLLDGWEFENGTNMLAADDAADPDGDGLTNAEEQKLGTNPLSADSDNDGLPDAYEVDIGSDPRVADSDGDIDGDGVNNLDQFYADHVSAPVHRSPAKRDAAGCSCSSSGEGDVGSGFLVAAGLMLFRLRRRFSLG